jgi:hypothetical protein
LDFGVLGVSSMPIPSTHAAIEVMVVGLRPAERMP